MENLNKKQILGLNILADLKYLDKDIVKNFSETDERKLKVWGELSKKIKDLAMMK